MRNEIRYNQPCKILDSNKRRMIHLFASVDDIHFNGNITQSE